GLTWPLLTRADGTKFGKSAAGENIWLDPALTSPYRFFQFWIQADDGDVGRLLAQLTLLPLSEVEEVLDQHARAPEARLAQRTLASELTTLVHGPRAADAALEASEVLFGGDAGAAGPEALALVAAEVPTAPMPAEEELAEGLELVGP